MVRAARVMSFFDPPVDQPVVEPFMGDPMHGISSRHYNISLNDYGVLFSYSNCGLIMVISRIE